MSNAYENGGAYIEYEFADNYARGADIIVTGYTIMVGNGHTLFYRRMPCDWKFQAYDAATSEWKTLDEYTGFRLWNNDLTYNDAMQLGFTFSFVNSASYRRYRLLITRQVWATISGFNPSSSNSGAMQISEICLHGYVGKNLAGTVVTANAEYPLKLVEWATNKVDGTYAEMTPTYATSPYTESKVKVNLSLLFNGLDYDRTLAWLNDAEGHTDEIPFWFSYEIPDCGLAGKTVMVTNYTIAVHKHWSGWDKGLPLKWTLEGYHDGEWVVLDRRSVDVVDWDERECPQYEYSDTNMLCYKTFEIMAGRRFSSMRYRLNISSFQGKYSTTRDLFMLSEVSLNGAWGKDIVRKDPAHCGCVLIVR